jgi:hypothetical protein
MRQDVELMPEPLAIHARGGLCLTEDAGCTVGRQAGR